MSARDELVDVMRGTIEADSVRYYEYIAEFMADKALADPQTVIAALVEAGALELLNPECNDPWTCCIHEHVEDDTGNDDDDDYARLVVKAYVLARGVPR